MNEELHLLLCPQRSVTIASLVFLVAAYRVFDSVATLTGLIPPPGPLDIPSIALNLLVIAGLAAVAVFARCVLDRLAFILLLGSVLERTVFAVLPGHFAPRFRVENFSVLAIAVAGLVVSVLLLRRSCSNYRRRRL